MARIIAIIGANNGMGGTAVAAHLSAALHSLGKSVLAIDCCPNNVMRLYFGTPWQEGNGFARALLDHQPWYESAYRSAKGVSFVPFGHLENEAELDVLCDLIEPHPEWLGNQIERLDLSPDTLVICDCPRHPKILRSHLMSIAHMVIIVMQPEPIALSNAQRLLNKHADNREQVRCVLVNAFDLTRALDRDVIRALQGGMREHLVPIMIHRDEFLRRR